VLALFGAGVALGRDLDRRRPTSPPFRSSRWLSHKAVSEKLLRDRGDGRQSGWV
jgi:hypothetical protein